MYHGHIDYISETEIRGWAYTTSKNQQLTLYIDNILVCNFTPTEIRDDVNKNLDLDKETLTGFCIKIDTLLINQICSVSVFFTENNTPLIGSPSVLQTTNFKKCLKTDFLSCYKDKLYFKTVTTIDEIFEADTDVLLVNNTISFKDIKNLQYLAYSSLDTSSSSDINNNNIYIRHDSLHCIKKAQNWDELYYQFILKGYKHKYCSHIEHTKKNTEFQQQTTSIEQFLQQTTQTDLSLYFNISYFKKFSSKKILYILSTLDGGTPLTNKDLMLTLAGEFTCFLLHCDKIKLTLSYVDNNVITELESVNFTTPITLPSHTSSEYDSYFIDILYRYQIDCVHIRHICWHSLSLTRATNFFKVPIIYSMHDYYAICPSHNLLDEKLTYCEGICTSNNTNSICQTVLWSKSETPPLKHCFVNVWREMFFNFLQQCQTFITTSQTTYDIYVNIYPFLKSRIHIITHGRDLKFVNARKNTIQDKLRIIVPGILTDAKGAQLLIQIKKLDVQNFLEFIFLGPEVANLKTIGVFMGGYKRDDIQSIVSIIHPNVAFIPSIWPETYCHVLTEMWACNIPTVVLNLGAQLERTLHTSNGWVVPRDPEYIYQFFLNFKVSEKTLTQNTISCLNMANEYKNVYNNLLNFSE